MASRHLPAHKTFPVPTSTTPFWRTQPSPLDTHRSTPELPPTSDIVIIGSGMTGVSIAYHILRIHNALSPGTPDPSILLLEARQLCSGATGRNGGHTKLACIHMQHVAEVGSTLLPPPPSSSSSSTYVNADDARIEAMAELSRFQIEQIYALKDVVEQEGIAEECEFFVTRSFDVFLTEEAREARIGDVVKRRSQGVDAAKKEVQILDFEGEEGEKLTGVRSSHGALSVPGAQLWPYKFVSGLLATFIDRINFQTWTQVDSVSSTTDSGGCFTLNTSRGETKAKKVIFATNAYTAGLLPDLYEGQIVPVRGTAAHVVRRDPTKHTGLQRRMNTYNLYYEPKDSDHLVHRAAGEDGVIVGTARRVYDGDESLWRGTVDDSALIMEKEVKMYFEDLLESRWRDWKESGARVDKLWTGKIGGLNGLYGKVEEIGANVANFMTVMGRTPDGYPHIGIVPDRQNQFICAGFNGAGMPHIFLAAKGLARMILEGTEFKHTGIPRIFEATVERLKKRVEDQE